jgi:hypothetical protein
LELTWRDRNSLEDHFQRHGREVNARSIDQYDALTRQTIERGVRFTFRNTSRPRAGYYDPRRHWLVVVDEVNAWILSLSRRSERYVRTQPDSTYGS